MKAGTDLAQIASLVGDPARANMLAMQAALDECAPVLNVATERSIELLTLWETICEAAGVPALEPEFLPARTGDVRESVASLAKTRAAIGFEPEVELLKGLQATLASGA